MRRALSFLMIFLVIFSAFSWVRAPSSDQLQLTYAHLDLLKLPDLDNDGQVFGDEFVWEIVPSLLTVHITMKAIAGCSADLTMRLQNSGDSAIWFDAPIVDFSVSPNEYATFATHGELFYKDPDPIPIGTPILMDPSGEVTAKEHLQISEECPGTVTVDLVLNFMYSMGPVGYWKFDEGSGSVAHDSSGYGNDGTIHTATWTTGRVGKALHFNGVDSWVQITNDPTLTGLSQITLEAWIQQDSITAQLKGIISKCDGWAPPTNAEYFLGTNDGGRVFFETDNEVAIFSDQSARLITEAGRWYHVAGTWSGDSYAIYVDGVQVLSGTCTPQITKSNSLDVQIGRHGTWSWVYFQGIIDEVKIYNYARTAEEIWNDYSSAIKVSLPWRDDFDYVDNQEMRDAGWQFDNEVMVSVGGGVLTVDNDGSQGGGANYRDHFADGIYDFKAEVKGRWSGRSYGAPHIKVYTRRHEYLWAGDAYYSQYVLNRDGVEVLRFGGYTPQLNVWQVFSVEKVGNILRLYQDGVLKYTYTETDSAPDDLIGVAATSHWLGTLQYDYISVDTRPSDEKPVAILTVENDVANIGANVWFYGYYSYDPDGGDIVEYFYDFGDGEDSGWVPEGDVHAYYTPGEYWTRLMVRDDEGTLSDWSEPHKVIVRSIDSLDAIYVIDLTGSMFPYMDVVKEQLIELTSLLLVEETVRVAVVGFKDYPEETSWLSWTQDLLEASNYIEGLDAITGGGLPQSHYLGLEKALELFEGSLAEEKIVVFIADAPAGYNDLPEWTLAPAAAQALADDGIKIHSVLCGPAEQPEYDLLKYYSDISGGNFIFGEENIVQGVLYSPPSPPPPPPWVPWPPSIPPPVAISLNVEPIFPQVGQELTLTWNTLSPPEIDPDHVELQLEDPNGAIILLATYNDFPNDFTGTHVWTVTPPEGAWKAMVLYYYIYSDSLYSAGAFAGFFVAPAPPPSGEKPVAILTVYNDVPNIGANVEFFGDKSYDPDGGKITAYFFDFDDESGGAWVYPPEVGIYHAYSASGEYWTRLKVVDDEGMESDWSEPHKVFVLPQPGFPIAILDVSPKTQEVGLPVMFDASESSDSDGWIVDYGFEFGDGSPIKWTSSPVETHSYTQPGEYFARVQVADNSGLEAWSTKVKVPITPGTPPPQPDFEISISPSSHTIGKEDHADYETIVTSKNGFDALISFGVSIEPTSDLTTVLYPPSVVLTPEEPESSLLIVSSTSATTAATYSIKLTAIGEGITHSKTVTLIVTTAWISTKLTIEKLQVTTPDGKKVVSNVIKSDVESDITLEGHLRVMAPWGETNIGVPFANLILRIADLPSVTVTTGLGGQFSHTFDNVKLSTGSYVLMATFSGDLSYKASRDTRTLISSPDAKSYTIYVGVYPDWAASYGSVAIYNQDDEMLDIKGTAGPWPFHTSFLVWGAPPDGWYRFVADVVYEGIEGTDALATDEKTVWIDYEGANVDLYPKLPRPYVAVAVFSPVDVFVTDPSGLSIGADPNSGMQVNEISGAFYSGQGTDPQLVIIPSPIEGIYNVVLLGTGSGDYTLTIEYGTSEQTVVETFSGTVSEQERRYYSALLSQSGEVSAISWEYVFGDTERGTILRTSTDDKYFQFVAPDKDFGIRQDPNMKITNRAIVIRYEDNELNLITAALDTKIDFCVVNAWNVQTGDKYYLLDKPGIE